MSTWMEMYRPGTLDEVIGQNAITCKLKRFVDTKDMPHLLFTGPAGTGKTTCALALAKDLYGDDWKESVLELNASNERRLDDIRERVKDFARTVPQSDVGFNIIFLDEADALTMDSQSALRRIMENHQGTCRFILSCNYASKIMDPIQSRCAVFRFHSLTRSDVKTLVDRICRNENIRIDDKAFDSLYEHSRGDMRRTVNTLQAIASVSDDIDESLVNDTVGRSENDKVIETIKTALSGKYSVAREMALSLMNEHNMSGKDLIRQMHAVSMNVDLPDDEVARLLNALGEADYRLARGCNERIQVDALIAYLVSAGEYL